MALGSYEAALGWLGSENRKSSIRVFFDFNRLCTGKLDVAAGGRGAMMSHNSINDIPAHANAELMNFMRNAGGDA